MEMVLDRSLSFSSSELDFSHVPPPAPLAEGGPQQQQQRVRAAAGHHSKESGPAPVCSIRTRMSPMRLSFR